MATNFLCCLGIEDTFVYLRHIKTSRVAGDELTKGAGGRGESETRMMRGKSTFLKGSCEQMIQGCQMNPELEVDMRERWSAGLMSPSSLLHQRPYS